MMQICSKCGEDKPLDKYYKRSDTAYSKTCKTCKIAAQAALDSRPDAKAKRSEYKRSWASKNKERIAQRQSELYLASRSERLERSAEWAEQNVDRVRKYKQKWKANNPGQAAEARLKRRRIKSQCKPAWALSEFERFAVDEIYRLCKLRTELTGIDWHVDHDVPLVSDKVCGLHCASNLRVVTAKYNLSKSNLTWEYQ